MPIDISREIAELRQKMAFCKSEIIKFEFAISVLEGMLRKEHEFKATPMEEISEIQKKPISLSDAVRTAVREFGPMGTSSVIEWIQRNYDKNCSRDSVRSLLSVEKKKGKMTLSKDGFWEAVK